MYVKAIFMDVGTRLCEYFKKKYCCHAHTALFLPDICQISVLQVTYYNIPLDIIPATIFTITICVK